MGMRTRILVCGGRNFTDYEYLRDALEKFCHDRKLYHDDDPFLIPNVTLISGDAKGADRLSIDWAIVNWLPIELYPADWKTYGRSAGLIRNKKMLEEAKPDVVLAFKGGRGTEHMKRIAREAGVEVVEL